MSTGGREGRLDDEGTREALLRVEDLTAGYGELIVLRKLSLDVRAGEIHCVSGRNGAGKSTLMHAIAGLLRPSAGTLSLGGEDITAQPAHRRPTLGIGYVPQGRRLFGALTVAENLDLAAGAVAGPPARGASGPRANRSGADGRGTGRRSAPARAAILARFPVLEERLGQRAETLSGGEQQMLATARALAVGPRLLLMDEPTEGLQPSMVATIRDTAASLAAEGVGVLLVEQRLDEVLDICSRVTFMENGTVRGSHAAEELRADATLSARYLGIA